MKDPNVMARNVMGAYGEGLDKSFCWRDFKGFLQLMVDAAWLAWQWRHRSCSGLTYVIWLAKELILGKERIGVPKAVQIESPVVALRYTER